MKIRSRLFSCRATPRRRFVLHPLSFAVCLAMSSAALALPQGGTVVSGSATITRPTTTSELIKQTTDKAIIDWKSFSIAAGEKVRFAQPSDTSITLNRVTGYDPSYILGQMSSNGKIFLVNPYGVVFGAGARVDVGGLVVSSLSIADNDFLAGRYNLSSVDPKAPAQRGEVRNDGLISAPGGTVVLAGPSVTNTGTIVANGGRVGLVAANSVSVDVEGDGLIFFDANATEAQNRLAQLGRIQADGGTVDMRAAARGAFADTVLNMAGVVQARSLGTREGHVVIDGGSEGITSVSGQIDASGAAAGQHGGEVAVLGQRILLDNGSRIDASGDAGGGAIRIGGDFHGANPALHNASAVAVEPDALLRADAGTKGDGGTVAVWSDGATNYQGRISATGGASGGDGGYVEVSGHQALAYDGNVDTRAAHGATGTLLLDPTDITIDLVGQSASVNNAGGVFTDPNSPSTIKASTIVGQLASTDVTVSTTPGGGGTGTITVATPISWSNGNSLTLKASTDIVVNTSSAITNGGTGDLNLFASGNITLNSAVSLAGGNFKVAGTAGGASLAGSFTSGAAGTVTTTGPNGSSTDGTPGGNVTIATSGALTVGNIATRGGNGPAEFSAGDAGNVILSSSNGAISAGTIDTTGGAGSGVTGGATGGHGGSVTVSIGAGAARTLDTGLITTLGGQGSDNLGANGPGGTGGAGGAVSISNGSGGTTTLQRIDTTGGAAGAAGSGVSDGGDGGAAGAISLTSSGGTLAVANLKARGGASSAPNAGGNPGTAGASQAISMAFGQATPGTLDLSNATSIAGASATATGGTGTDTMIVVGGAGETLTLTPALLARSSAGNVTLSSVEAADITAGTGTTNLAGWTGGRTATVQLTAGAGAITGNGVGTTLRGLDSGSTFTVNAADGGSVDTTTFSAVGNLAGGAGADTFAIANAGTLSGNIDAGAGANALDLSAKAGAITINQSGATTGSGVAGTITGIGSYTGNGANTTFVGSNAAQTYTISAADTVSVAGMTLNGVGNITGGSAADTFAVQAAGSLSGAIDGGGGANTLDLSALASANFGLTGTHAGTASSVSGGFSNIGSLIGNGTSVLTGSNAASTFRVTTNNAGTVDDGVGTTSFSGVNKLVGGSAADGFVISAGAAIGDIDGGGGANSLSVTAGAAEDITLTDAQLSRSVAGNTALAGIGSASLAGGAGSNTIDAGTWSGTLALQLSAGADVLTGNGVKTTLVAAAAGSTINVTAADAGNAGATTFTQVGNLLGGAGSDVFAIAGTATLGGAVTGVAGNDTLDLSARAGAITINQSGAVTGSGVAGAITGIGTYVGNGANTTFVGNNSAQTYIVGAPDSVSVAGTTINGVGSLTGGSAADTFVLQGGGTLSGAIDGGGGANTLDLSAKTGAADFALTSATVGTASGVGGGYSNIASLVGKGATSTLTGSNAASAFVVNASNAGTVNDGTATTSFSGIGTLVGGSAGDSFALVNAGSLGGSIDGGAGANTLDLSGKAGAADLVLTSASAGTASGVTGGYSNVTVLAGNGSSSTLTGTNAPSTYTLTGAGSGSVGTTTFSGIASIVGGSSADAFVLQGAGALSGSIDGGAGANTLDLSAKAGAGNFALTSASAGTASGVGGGYGNVATLIGNGTTSTLTGSSAASTFTVTRPNAGTVNGATSFSGIANLAGGAAADAFVLLGGATLSGTIDGGAGANSLDLSARGTADFALASALAGTASGVGGGYSNVGTLVGNGTSSSLTGSNTASTFTVTANNAGTVNDGTGTTNFSGVPGLVGGAAADAFVIGTGVAIGSIDGGAGAANSLGVTAGAAENITLADALLSRSVAGNTTLANVTSASLTGGSGNNVIDASGWTGARLVSIQISSGTDSIVGNGLGTTLVAAPGGSTISVTSADAGNAGTTSFTQVGNLMGGAGPDTFAITNAATLSGAITGVGGNDTLDLSGKTGVVTISQSGATTGSGVAGAISGVSRFVGNGANSTFVGNNTAQTYTVTAPDTVLVAGNTLNGIGSLTGGSAADTFIVQAAGSLSGHIDGGAGANTLDLSTRAAAGSANFGLASASSGTAGGVAGGYSNVATLIGNGSNSILAGSNTASTFTVNAVNAGTVSDATGTSTFSGIASLVGGAAADSFVIANAGTLSGSIDGGGGANSLDLSARGTANFTLTSNTAGTASGVAGGYGNVGSLVGNGVSSTLTGSNAATSYSVAGADAGTVNGVTNFSGIANLVGGSGADTFALGGAGTLSGSIDGGAGANTLDLSARGTADFTLTSASAGSASGVTGGYANVTALVGNGGSSTLAGTNAASTFVVTAANSGTLNAATTFAGVANLTGGTADDTFVVQNAGSLSGHIDGGAGANTLNLSGRGTANVALSSATAGTASGVADGYGNVATLVGNGTTSTLSGTNAASAFSITGNNSGSVNDGTGTTAFSGMPRLVGGSAADSFAVGTGFAIGSIDGGTGAANSLSTTAGASENITLADAQLTRSVAGTTALANITAASLAGGSGNNVIDASGWSAPRTVTIQASAGADSITGNGVGTTVIGTAAPSTFNLTGPDSGTLSDGVNVTTLVSGVGNLTGGAGNDTFLIQNPGTLSGSLDGGGGLNTLDLSNKSSATIVFNTSSNSVSGVGITGTLSNIGALIGNVTNTSLQGNATGQVFTITADNEITVDGNQVFKGVANLDAGSGADTISGTTFKLAGHIDDTGGVTTLSGTIRTDGSQTYAGPVLAPAVTLVALGGISAVNPANDFGTASLTGGAIDVHDANAINLTSLVVGAGQPVAITAAGTITLNGNVTSTADQSYNGNVALAANAVLDAGAGHVAVQGSLDGGSHDLTLASTATGAGAITLGGAVGNVAIFNANGNATLNGNVSSSGPQTFAGTVTLAADTALDAGASKLDLRGAVDGGGHSLVTTSGNAAADAIHVGGAIGNTTQFSANGRSTLGANVTTTGNQTYTGTVTLAADATLDAGAGRVTLQAGLDGSVASHSVTLVSTAAASNAIATGGPVANVGVFAADGNTTLAGNVASAGTQTFAGTLTLTGDTTLDAGGGKVDLQGAVDGGGHSLAATSSNAAADAIRVGGAIGNAAQFTANGRSTLGADVTTSGNQAYSDAVTLGVDTTLTGNSISFGGTVDGGFNLAVKAGATAFAGPVGSTTALASLTTDAAGSTQIGSSVRTTGAQTYNDNLVLTGDSAMSGSALVFNGEIDGAHALALTSGSPVILAQAVGATTPLAALSVAGPLTLGAPSIATTGAQTFGGAVALQASSTLTGSTLGFASTIDGAFALTLNGASSFAGAVGAGTALDSLTTNGAVQIAGNGTLRSAAIDLNGPVSGAADLSLQTNALSGGNSIAGTGTFSIAPIDPALSIGVAGGTGSLQVAQSVLTGATGFGSHVIGSADGSGTIAVGNLTLAADTTLQTASGDINLTGSVDGAHALTLNSGGTTRITGPIGATTPLTSLTTDNNATAPDWNGTSGERTTFDSADGSGAARIVTTGAQTYNDPVTASVPIALTGGAITATQASNSFAGAVSAIADSLQLKATGDLTLGGTITLSNGGAVEAGGILHLNGALQLNGGTLVLTSNAALSPAATFNDPSLPVDPRFGGVTLNEASAAIVQDGGTIKSAAGSLLVLRSPNGGSILLDQLDAGNLPVNQLLGSISAVSGALADDGARFNGGATTIDLGFIRIASSEIHVAGRPSGTDQTTLQAGLEGDVIKLTADVLTTGNDGLIRARLPFNSLQGSMSSIPALTFVLTPTALADATPPNATSYGNPSPDSFIQIQIGSAAAGGFITARPIGLAGSGAGKVIFLGGAAEARPFYDGNGKLTEIRIFYNGDAPRTPQEAGALAAVIAIIEEARHARFEEAVRTENVSSRLRSGVIAEVGAGRPATVGRESIKLPETCDVKPGTLRCE